MRCSFCQRDQAQDGANVEGGIRRVEGRGVGPEVDHAVETYRSLCEMIPKP